MTTRPRSPLSPPVPCDYPSRAATVVVHHPGYDSAVSTLLTFTASDGCAEQPGVRLDLVHCVCTIVAANAVDGWLSTVTAPSVAIPFEPTGTTTILPAGHYFFHVPGYTEVAAATSAAPAPETSTRLPASRCVSDRDPDPYLHSYPYPIVPNFREWSFPRRSTGSAANPFEQEAALPAAWTLPPIQTAVEPFPINARARDRTCRVSGYGEETTMAHIIPKPESDWAERNQMEVFRVTSRDNKGVAQQLLDNAITLRFDIHNAWDNGKLSIIPYCSRANDTTSAAWALHVRAQSKELHHLYHNRQLHVLSLVARPYLFARFAYDFFPDLRCFLQMKVRRTLRLRTGEINTFSSADCEKFCEGQGRGRSVSPSKRARNEVADGAAREANESPSKRTRVKDTESDAVLETNGLAACSPDSAIELEGKIVEDGDEDTRGEKAQEQSAGDYEECYSQGSGISEDEEEEVDQDEDAYYVRRRREAEEREALSADPDPHGTKRRREILEEEEEVEEDEDNGDEEAVVCAGNDTLDEHRIMPERGRKRFRT